MPSKIVQVTKTLVAILLAAGGGMYSYLLFLARIDSASDFKRIVVIDLLIGLFWCLPVFLFFGNYLRKSNWRSTAVPYLIVAFLISLFFLFLHFNQVSIRGGGIEVPFQLLFSK